MQTFRQRRHRSRILLDALEPRQLLTFSVATPIADITLPYGANANSSIDLSNRFAVSGTLVRFHVATNAPASTGDVYLELTDAATPVTVANFLNYVSSDRYDNTIIHRLVPGFVMQGGGFAGATFSTLAHIATDAPIVNEFSPTRSNVRGTIAMAKVGGDPNSATSEWFINLANNGSNLDNQNGGFTTFGTVVAGMDLVDYIAANVPWYNGGGAFSNIPLVNYDNESEPTTDDFVNLQSASTVPATYTYSVTANSNPALVTPVLSGSTLNLAYAPNVAGTASITVTATDPAGRTVSDTFQVNVPQISISVDGAPLTDNQSTPVAYGGWSQGVSAVKEFTIRNNGDTPLSFTLPTVPADFAWISPLTGTFPNFVPNLPTLQPGNSTTFKVALRTSSPGSAKFGTLVINSSDPHASAFEIPLTGTVTFRDITVKDGSSTLVKGQTAPINLGTASRGATLQHTFTVTNDGDENLAIGDVTVPAGFTVVTDLPDTIAPGTSASLIIALDTSAAAAAGAKSGKVTIPNNDLDEGPFDFVISATLISPRLAATLGGASLATGQPLDFGTTEVADVVQRTLTFTNSGNGDLSFGAPVVPAGFTLITPPPSTLAPGGSASVVIAIDTSSRGTKSGTLTFPSNDPTAPNFSLALSGTVLFKGIVVSLAGNRIPFGTTSAVDFGRVRKGAPAQMTFSVANSGLVPLSLQAVSIPAGYTVIQSLPDTLPAGSSADLTVSLDTAATGTYNGTLRIASSDPDRANFDIPLAASVSLPISLGAGGAKAVTFIDADGTLATLKLSGPGSATLDFFGADLASTAGKSSTAVTGTGILLGGITFSGTSAATKFMVTTRGGNNSVDVGDLTAAGPLNAIAAKTVRLTGNASLAGLRTLELGAVAGAAVTSTAPVGSLKVANWTGGTLSAPMVSQLTVAGNFDPAVTLSSTSLALGTASIKGTLSGTWTVAGSISKLSAGTIASWSAHIAGTLTSVTANALSSSSLSAGSVGKVTVKGGVQNSLLRSAGNFASLSAGSLSGTDVYAGVTLAGSASLPSSLDEFTASATLGSLKAKSFSDSNVAARALGKVSPGLIQTSNNGTPFGFAADAITSLTAKLNTGKAVKLVKAGDPTSAATQLATAGTLADLSVRVL